MPGIIEIITLLLGLTGFGFESNPNAPTADAALQYAMPDADVVIHFDGAVIVPKNYAVLANLVNQPQIKASPELLKMVRDMTGQMEGARGMAKTMTGFDPVTDIADGTMTVVVPASGDPTFVVQVHGKFTPALIDKIASMSGQPVGKVNGGSILEGKGDQPAVAVTSTGVLLAGTTKLVRDRLAATWKMPARPANSALAMAAEVIATRPIFAIGIALSPTAKARALADQHGETNFATDLMQRGRGASFAVYADGIAWTWNDKTKAGADSMAMMSEGLMELLRAAAIAPRGLAKIAIGALDSYKGKSKQIDALIAHKADLMKLVETYSGDGNFKVAIATNPKSFQVTARATGKSLSEVVPAGMLVPIGALFFGRDTGAALSGPSARIATPPGPGPAPKPRQPAPAPHH